MEQFDLKWHTYLQWPIIQKCKLTIELLKITFLLLKKHLNTFKLHFFILQL